MHVAWRYQHLLAHKHNKYNESSRWHYSSKGFCFRRTIQPWAPKRTPELLNAAGCMVNLAAQKQWSWLFACKNIPQPSHTLYCPKNQGMENTLQREGEEAVRALRKHLRQHRSDILKSGSILWSAFPRKVENGGSLESITFKCSETCSKMVSCI